MFANKSALFGIFNNKEYAEEHKNEMEEALKSVYISIYKDDNFDQELVCMLDNITLNVIEIPFDITDIEFVNN